MDTVGWRDDIFSQISARNCQQDLVFRDLFSSYRQLLSCQKSLREKNAEMAELQNERVLLQEEIKQLKANGVMNVSSSNRLKELEDKVMCQQEELMQLYKTRAQDTSSVLDMTTQIKKMQAELAEKEKINFQFSEAVSELSTAKADLEKTVAEKDGAIELLRSELEAMKGDMKAMEQKLSKVNEENAQIVDRMLHAKQTEVDLVNEAMALSNELKRTKEELARVRAASSLSASGGAAMGASGTAAGGGGGSAKSFLSFMHPLLGGSSPTGSGSAHAEHKPADLLAEFETEEAATGGLAVYGRIAPPKDIKHSVIAHEGEVNCVTFNEMGNLFATGSNDKTVKIWDSRTCMVHSTLYGAVSGVMRVAFSSNGESLLGASNDTAVRLWSVHTGRVKHTLTGHTNKIYGADFADDGRKAVTGGHDRTIKIWDLNSGYLLKTTICFSSCNDLASSKSGGMIVSGHFDNAIRFWDLRTGNMEEEILDAHTQQLTSVSLSNDGRYVLSNGKDNVLKLFDLRTHTEVSSFRNSDYRNGLNWNKACISPNGAFIAAGSSDGCLFVWNVASGKLETTIKGHKAAISGVAWSPDGTCLASSGLDKHYVLWH